MLTVAVLVVPTSYPSPAASVMITDSVGSTLASSVGRMSIVAVAEPSMNVAVALIVV